MSNIQAVLQAEQRIRPYIRKTPLQYSPYFSKETGAKVYFKLENMQHTASFKVRGALSKMLALSAEQRERGIVTASSGNHGAATAFALQKVVGKGKIFVPNNVSPTKAQAIRTLGQEIIRHGDDGIETENHARQYAEENGMIYVSPYNDTHVIGGQGTIGVEIAQQIDHVDAVFVTIGGGGLISGIGLYLKSVFPQLKMIGCSPENSPVMLKSLAAGKILEMASLPTLSDGSAGGVENNTITFPLCQKLVDDAILVSEAAIEEAMREFIKAEHLLLEGAAGVALAALQKEKEKYLGKTVVIIICGGNIGLEVLKNILA